MNRFMNIFSNSHFYTRSLYTYNFYKMNILSEMIIKMLHEKHNYLTIKEIIQAEQFKTMIFFFFLHLVKINKNIIFESIDH